METKDKIIISIVGIVLVILGLIYEQISNSYIKFYFIYCIITIVYSLIFKKKKKYIFLSCLILIYFFFYFIVLVPKNVKHHIKMEEFAIDLDKLKSHQISKLQISINTHNKIDKTKMIIITNKKVISEFIKSIEIREEVPGLGNRMRDEYFISFIANDFVYTVVFGKNVIGDKCRYSSREKQGNDLILNINKELCNDLAIIDESSESAYNLSNKLIMSYNKMLHYNCVKLAVILNKYVDDVILKNPFEDVYYIE